MIKQHQQTSRRRRSAQKKRDSRASLNSEQIRTVATTNVTTTATNAATIDHRSERGKHATQRSGAEYDIYYKYMNIYIYMYVYKYTHKHIYT